MVAMLSRVVSTFLCWRANECPWPCVAGALILCAVRVTRLARGRDSPTLRVRSLITWAVKRGADACAVGGDAYAAALNGEVRVFCFPTVACCVVGEERGAQVAVKHGVQRNRFDCFLLSSTFCVAARGCRAHPPRKQSIRPPQMDIPIRRK